jgi:hypothetical protein
MGHTVPVLVTPSVQEIDKRFSGERGKGLDQRSVLGTCYFDAA